MVSVGVVGLGFVGGTIHHVMKFYHEKVMGYDKYKESDSFEEVLTADVIFVALPTKLKEGRLDNSIVIETLIKLEEKKYKGIVIIKSTLSLKDIEDITKKLNLRIVFMPEFLHVKKRLQDFVNPNVVVIAGDKDDVQTVINEVFYWLDKQIPIFHVDYLTAGVSKLVMNAFASAKISFTNEIRRICSSLDVNPKIVMDILVANKRAIPEYTDPTKGPFLGLCLPKDLEELINCTDKSIMLKAVLEVNEITKKEFAARVRDDDI